MDRIPVRLEKCFMDRDKRWTIDLFDKDDFPVIDTRYATTENKANSIAKELLEEYSEYDIEYTDGDS